MGKSAAYDVFVSYRRSSSESANLIATSLKAKGFRVFFDVESLRGGKFNEQLYEVIDNCTDFLLVLPENALDRCNDPEDWVRKEVLRAMEHNKNIIPVTLKGFEWPSPMPEGMEGLNLYQALTATSNELFPLSMERLAKDLLKSKPHRSLPKTAKVAAILSSSLLVIILALYIVFRFLSLPLCDKTSSVLLHHVGLLDDLGEYEAQLQEKWDAFFTGMNSSPSYDSRYEVYREFLASLDFIDGRLERDIPADTTEFSFSGYEAFLLALHGINATDLAKAPKIIAGNFHDLHSTIGSMRLIIQNGMMTETNICNIKNALDIYPHALKISYFYYLEFLNSMPDYAMASCEDLSSGFHYLPPVNDIHLDNGEYIDAIEKENIIIERLIAQGEAMLQQSATTTEYVDERLANLNYFLNAAAQLEEVRKANEAEIDAHKEKIAMMQASNDARRQKIAELDKELEAVYEDFKAQCALEEADGKWLKWGKIVKFASYMGDMCNRRKEAGAKGLHSTSAITPAVLYAYLSSLLNTFKEYHPESAAMAESAKAFYKEVSQGKRSLSGVIVAAIKDDAKHPVFEIGDIIITLKGQEAETYEQLKKINKADDSKPSVTFLRLENNELVEHSSKDCNPVDIVGFTGLNNK